MAMFFFPSDAIPMFFRHTFPPLLMHLFGLHHRWRCFLMFFRCPSISWFQVVSERLIHLFLQLGHLRVFQIIFQVIFLFSIFWKHHEDDTNVLPYCTIIVDSKGGWPCEKAWYSKCFYLMVCYEIEKGLPHVVIKTFVIYFFHTWSMKISGIHILSALLQVG